MRQHLRENVELGVGERTEFIAHAKESSLPKLSVLSVNHTGLSLTARVHGTLGFDLRVHD